MNEKQKNISAAMAGVVAPDWLQEMVELYLAGRFDTHPVRWVNWLKHGQRQGNKLLFKRPIDRDFVRREFLPELRLIGITFVDLLQNPKEMAENYVKTAYPDIQEQARLEGWLWDLQRYLSQTAKLQASLMAGIQGAYDIPHHIHNDAVRVQNYVDYCAKQARLGIIHAPLSNEMTVLWATKAKERRKDGSQPTPDDQGMGEKLKND